MAQLITPSEQERIAQTKIDSFNEPQPVLAAPGAEPTKPWEEAKLVLQDLKNNGIDLAKGSAAGALGLPVDLMAMAVMVGYSGLNWLSGRAVGKGGDFTLAGFDTPGGAMSFGNLFGADTEGVSFIAGNFVSPAQGAKGALLAAKVVGATGALKTMVVGARTATLATTGTLEAARAMRNLGKADTDIWQETGWFPEVDKKGGDVWKYVLSDADSVVNEAKITKQAESLLMGIGDEGEIVTTLGEIFEHPTLFDAYPHLKEAPVRVAVLRVKDTPEGVAEFIIHNERASKMGIQASTKTTDAGKTITLFDGESARSTILHEVQHLVQGHEGFDGGTNVAKFLGRLVDTRTAQINKNVVDDIIDGTITPFMDQQEYIQYAVRVSEQHKVNSMTVLDAVDEFLFAGVDIDEAKILADHEAFGKMRDLRLMLEEVGLQLVDADAHRMANQIAENFSFGDAKRLSRLRYNRQAGEIEARLTETLRDQTQEQIQKLPLKSVARPQDAIVGDAAQ